MSGRADARDGGAMRNVKADVCRGSGRILDKHLVQNTQTGQWDQLYTCPVCGAYLQPLKNGGCYPHVDWNARNQRLGRMLATGER